MFDFQLEPGKKLHEERRIEFNEAPLVSIITPYYNADKYIVQTYNCVINQTFPWFEWIIVDDGSAEEKAAVLEQLAVSDGRIHIFHKKNGGISTARNLGIRKAQAELLVMLDADDLIAPTYLEVLYWLMLKNPDRGWGYTNTIGFENQQYMWEEKFDAERLKTYNFLTYSGIIRKDAIVKIGCYEEAEKHFYEDWHLWLRLLGAGITPVKSSLYGFWYRRLDTGVLAKVSGDKSTRQVAEKKIRCTAAGVDGTLTAKEYPSTPLTNQFPKPCRSTWNRCRKDLDGKYSILFVVPWLQKGGAEVFELELLRKIDKDKFHITVVTTVDAPYAWRQRFEAYTDDVFELPAFLDMEHYGEFISYLIQSRNIHLTMVTNSYYGYYLMPWLRREFPDMAIIDYVHMEELYWRQGGYARISGVMSNITEHTYVCNQRTEQAMVEHFGKPEGKISTLYIGVDQQHFSKEQVVPGECRKAMGIPDSRQIILFPCRMDLQKRPFLMLKIAQETKRRGLPVVFVAVGDGPLLQELKNTCRDMHLEDTVYFTGWQEDLRPFYRDAALTLNCSIREGLALTAYESCAMGVPVISTDAGGQRELIDDRNGKILPIYQEEAEDFTNTNYTKQEISQFADAIEDLLQNEKSYRAKCSMCRKRIEEAFSSDIMVQKIEKEFLYYIENQEALSRRQAVATALNGFSYWAEELPALFYELEARDAIYSHGFSQNDKNELMRIANSKWGRRLIKVFFKLKLNRLLH